MAVPGSAPGKLAKAPHLGADEVVVDLEDAVLPAAKDQARGEVIAALERWPSGANVAVRVNAPGSRWCHEDLVALAGLAGAPSSVVIPKVESAGDLAFVERLLDGVEAGSERRAPLRVQALIETAAGLESLREIARASRRLDALILGYADLAVSLGGARGLDGWLPAQHAVLTAARAAGVQAIDGPHLGIEVDDGFREATARAGELGFDGKWAIHPGQIDALNIAFAPTEQELQDARAVLAALDGADQGAAALDGQMLDEAVKLRALQVLAKAG